MSPKAHIVFVVAFLLLLAALFATVVVPLVERVTHALSMVAS